MDSVEGTATVKFSMLDRAMLDLEIASAARNAASQPTEGDQRIRAVYRQRQAERKDAMPVVDTASLLINRPDGVMCASVSRWI